MADTVLGTAILQLGTDQSQLDREIAQAEGKVRSFGQRASEVAGNLDAFANAAADLNALGDAASQAGPRLDAAAAGGTALDQAMSNASAALRLAADALDQVIAQSGATAAAAGGVGQMADAMQDVAAESQQAGEAVKRAGDALSNAGDKGKSAADKLGRFGLAMLGIQQASNILERITSPLRGFFDQAISGASDLDEAINKTQVVFGDAAGVILDWSRTTAEAVGLAAGEAQEAASNFGALFQGAGQSAREAADMTQELITRAADLASIYNLDVADALAKLRSGLVGEAEPLRALNIFISEAAVQAKAMELGLAGAHGQLSEGEKILARYALIMEQSQLAAGDFQRTSDGLANAQRILRARLVDLQAQLGQFLLPAMERGVAAASRLVEWFSNLPEPVQRTAVVIGAVVLALGAALPMFGALAVTVGALSAPFLAVTAAVAGLVAVVGVLIANWGAITERFPAVQTAVDGVRGAFASLWEVIQDAAPVAGQAIGGFVRVVLGHLNILVTSVAGVGRAIGHLMTGQWHKLDDDFQQAKQGILRGLEQIRDGVVDVATAHREWGRESERASRGMSLIGGRTVDMILHARQAEQAIRDNVDALQAWADAQRVVDAASERASDAISVWERRLSDAEKALGILEEKRKRQGQLSAEEQEQYETLQWYVARLANGIRDDLNDAYVDAQAKAAELMRAQEELKRALDEGTITQEEYNEAVAKIEEEARRALDPNNQLIESNEKLTSVIDRLVESLETLLVKFGLIPPEVTTKVEVEGYHEAGTAADDLTNKWTNVPGLVVTTAEADTKEAQRRIQELRQDVNSVPGSFTIRADVDISAAEQKITQLGRLLPHSPAEEGPLSVEPNWDWLFSGIERAAGRYTEDALDHLRNFAQTARAVWDALSAQVGFARDVAEAPVPVPDEGLIARLQQHAQHVIQSLGDTAALYSEEFLSAARELGSSVRTAYDALSAQVGFARELAEADGAVDRYLARAESIQARLKFAAEHAVRSLADSAAVMGGPAVEQAGRLAEAIRSTFGALSDVLTFARQAAGIVPDALDIAVELFEYLPWVGRQILEQLSESVPLFDGPVLSGAERVSGAMRAALGLAKDALDFARQAADVEPDLTVPVELFEYLPWLARQILQQLAEAVPLFERDVLEGSERVSNAMRASLGVVRDALEFAERAQIPAAMTRLPQRLVGGLVSLARDALAHLRAAGGAISPDDVEQAEAAAAALAAPFRVLQDALAFVQDAAAALQSGARLTVSARMVDSLMAFVRELTARFRDAAEELGVQTLTEAQALAEAAGAVFAALQPVTDAVNAVRGARPIRERQIQQFIENIRAILGAVAQLRAEAEARLEDALVFQAVMEAIAAALGAAAQAVESIQTIIGQGAATVQQVSRTITQAVQVPTINVPALAPAGAGAAAGASITVAPSINLESRVFIGDREIHDYIMEVVDLRLAQRLREAGA